MNLGFEGALSLGTVAALLHLFAPERAQTAEDPRLFEKAIAPELGRFAPKECSSVATVAAALVDEHADDAEPMPAPVELLTSSPS